MTRQRPKFLGVITLKKVIEQKVVNHVKFALVLEKRTIDKALELMVPKSETGHILLLDKNKQMFLCGFLAFMW